MRGYFSFLIVFAACLLLVSLVQFNVNSKYSNPAGSLWVERYYQAEMNIKEAIVEAAREGAVEGIIAYSEIYSSSGCAARLADGDLTATPNLDCVEYYINKRAVEKISALDGSETDGMRFAVMIDPQYASAAYDNICETQPCGVIAPPAGKKVVGVFDLDPASLPLDSQPVAFGDAEKALGGTTLQIKKDLYTQQSPIRITIKNAGFDDVTFYMPAISINWG